MVETTIRWSGLALVAGALLMGAALAMVSLRLPVQLPTPLASMILLVASLLIMLALPGMYARQSEAAAGLDWWATYCWRSGLSLSLFTQRHRSSIRKSRG